jgi:hypothetical protein
MGTRPARPIRLSLGPRRLDRGFHRGEVLRLAAVIRFAASWLLPATEDAARVRHSGLAHAAGAR